jgi:hypothetical protein
MVEQFLNPQTDSEPFPATLILKDQKIKLLRKSLNPTKLAMYNIFTYRYSNSKSLRVK